MSLFESSWDSGTVPIINLSATNVHKKRKRASDLEHLPDDAPTPTPTAQPGPNLDRLMKKMQKEARNTAAPSTSESSGPSTGKKDKKKKNKDNTAPVPSTPSHHETTATLARPHKKFKTKKQGSDDILPSSAVKQDEENGKDDETVSPIPTLKATTKGKKKAQLPKPTVTPGEGLEAEKSVENDSLPDEYAGLTKMQKEMKMKLSGGRFRMINELLYKSDSSSAHDMMRKDPNVYEEYHTGFRNQVISWPTNPVAHYTEVISKSYTPNSTVIADLGCGDATLAKNLVPQGFRVMAFDLVSDGQWVIEADVCDKIPLPGAENAEGAQVVDIVVCALSLMSLNWIRCVREARRILKTGGELKIAEVTSRFTDVEAFKSVICSLGFDFVSKDEPSTHFVLFEFCKSERARPLTDKAWKGIESKAKDLLAPCEYKRR